MEFALQLSDLDDARDLFTIAKERLLDVNEWDTLLGGSDYKIGLYNSREQKAQRNMRVDDVVHISNSAGGAYKIRISKIQYDIFPDIRSESISVLLSDDSTKNSGYFETILIKREGAMLTVHCNSGNELPEEDAETPNDRLNVISDNHPLLQISSLQLARLLQGFIAAYAYHRA